VALAHTLHVGAGVAAPLSSLYEQYWYAFVADVVTAVLQYAKQSLAVAILVEDAVQPVAGAAF